MPRLSHAALSPAAGCILWLATATAAPAVDSHLDRSIVEGGCNACHEGHGLSRSPMLPAPQVQVCLSCHGSQAQSDRQVSRGQLAPGVRPESLADVLAKPFTHPMSPLAFSRREPSSVVCTSCHSPHRGTRELRAAEAGVGSRRLSTRDPDRFEFELCQECHGSAGSATQSFLDISRLTSPQSRSFHPIEAPTVEGSPSVAANLAGLEINCSDCHGSSDPAGAAGPHGSDHRYILSQQYLTVDGSKESAEAYALCYECHDREAVLETSPFPFHAEHVVDEMTSCATCHSAHGSVDNRALIRFGEETFVAGVGPSLATGRLEFVSDGPGGGSCFLTCHGVDHAPLGYGGTATAELDSLVPDALTTAPPGLDERSPRVPRRRVIRDPPR